MLGQRNVPWAGALVYWLREETCNQKVVSSNPGIRILDGHFSHLFVVKNCNNVC